MADIMPSAVAVGRHNAPPSRGKQSYRPALRLCGRFRTFGAAARTDSYSRGAAMRLDGTLVIGAEGSPRAESADSAAMDPRECRYDH